MAVQKGAIGSSPMDGARACVSALFTVTNRIVGRMAASAMASASARSFFCRFTNGFT